MMVLDGDLDTHISTAYNSLSYIDVSISSPSISSRLEWYRMDDTSGSDHFPIWIEVQRNALFNPGLSGSRPKWNLKKAKWTDYQKSVKLHIPPHISSIKLLVETVTQKIIAAAEKSIPLQESYPKRMPVPWWNEECNRAKMNRNTAFKNYSQVMNIPNLILYKKARAKATLVFNQAKQTSWVDYVSNLSVNTSINKIWKRIKKIQGKHTPPPVKHLEVNNKRAETKTEIVEFLADNFQGNQSVRNSNRDFALYREAKEKENIQFPREIVGNDHYNEDFCLTELQHVIKTAGNTSVGPDLIHYQFLKQMSEADTRSLLNFYNIIWRSGEYSSCWKRAIVVPILKRNKDPSSPKSFRPISLTSCLGKILDKLINMRLYRLLEQNDLIPKEQSGFRKGRSSIDNLLLLENDIRRATFNKQFLTAVFLDIEKAYDSCWSGTILRELCRFNLRGRLPNIIKSFLSNRSFQVSLDEVISEARETELGIPQGSSLSVTLFSIAINTIKPHIPKPVKFLIYVDDIVIYHVSSHIRTSERILQNILNNIREWSNKTNFRISAEKSYVMKFTSNFHNQENPRMNILNSQIPVVTEGKFLGMILDKSLKWGPHIKDLKTRIDRATKLIQMVSNTKWGADTNTCLLLYKACIRPILDYGAILYRGASKTNLSILERGQNRAIRLALGAFRTSPTESLLVEANVSSLEDRRDLLSLKYLEKVLNHPNHPVKKILSNPIRSEMTLSYPGKIPPIANKIIELKRKYDVTNITTKAFHYQFLYFGAATSLPICNRTCTETKSEIDIITKSSFLEHAQGHPHVHIYTDGAKGSDSKGAAVFIPTLPQLNRMIRLSWCTSIFSTEAMAILEAIQVVKSEDFQAATIFSDSKSVLLALKNTYHPNDIIMRIKGLCNELMDKGIILNFCWSPGHVGIEGNENADCLAKRATQEGREIAHPISINEFVSIIKDEQYKVRQENWRNSNSKLKTFKPNIGPLKTFSGLNRQDEVRIRRLRIGHTRATHEFLLKREDPPICRFCNTRATISHILYECYRGNRPRSPLLGTTPRKCHLTDTNHLEMILEYLRTIKIKI